MAEFTERFINVIDTLVADRKVKSVRQVASTLGIRPSQISEARAGFREIPLKYLHALCDTFNINPDFIINGSGPIYKSENFVNEVSAQYNGRFISDFDYPISSDERVTDLGNGKYALIVPLIPEYAYAGYVSGWSDPEYLEELPKHMVIVDHPPKGQYRAVEVVGESMENWLDPEMAKQSIRDGEIVTGRNIPQHYWTSRFHIHKFKDFIIVHKEGIIVKRIIAHDVEKGIITCHSLNPDKEAYPDFEIHLDDVKQILNIVHPKR